jgi:mono/diheme cytochrome c family protein
MPRVVSSIEDARDLAAYLATLRDTVQVPPSPGAEEWPHDASLVAEGAQLFSEYQCLGCHSLRGRGNAVGPALDGVGARRPAAYVMALLRDPQSVIRGTAMDDKEPRDEEARALTAYLMTLLE